VRLLAPTRRPKPHLRNPSKYPLVVLPSAARFLRSGRICGARNLLFPPPQPSLQLQLTPHKHPLPTPQPLTQLVILSVARLLRSGWVCGAKDLIPSRQPQSLRRLRRPPSPTTHRGPAHPLRNLPQIGTPTRSTSTTTAASSSTANPFRINTYTPARNC
jgi:hypothetical protein